MGTMKTIIAIMISKYPYNEFMTAIMETKMAVMKTKMAIMKIIIAIMISKFQKINS